MIEFEARFKIVTPLFMSGANRDRAELRPASIKGVLRFWWRSLALSEYNSSWRDVRDAEFDLFGSASRGQSRVHFSLEKSKYRSGSQLNDGLAKNLWAGLRYLGYGAVQPELRPYLDSPIDVTLKIYLRPSEKNDPEAEADLLEDAIIAMGFLGGLGSRSRRGFGSFNLLELKRDGKARYSSDKDGYIDCISRLFEEHARALSIVPEYTAFNQDSRVYLLKTGNDPLKLLDEIGEEMQMYRSWGKDNGGRHMVGDKPAEQNFKDDHKNMLQAISSAASEHPQRIAFGLPHNYNFSRLGTLFVLPEKYNQKPSPHDRRSSPLLLHIHEISEQDYAAIASVFPTKFLPDNERILIKRDGNEQLLPLRDDWPGVLIDFIEGDIRRRSGQKRFPECRLIWPKPKAVSS